MSHLEIADFDRYLTDCEKEMRKAAALSNGAFVAAMQNAIARGREKATAGTYVDHSPPVTAKKLRGSLPASCCGSPAALCMEAGSAQVGLK